MSPVSAPGQSAAGAPQVAGIVAERLHAPGGGVLFVLGVLNFVGGVHGKLARGPGVPGPPGPGRTPP